MQEENQLNQVKFLEGVSKETLIKMWDVGSVRKYGKSKILFSARESTDMIFIQLSGKSMIYHLSHNGGRKIIFILGPGSLLNDRVAVPHTSANYCETIEKSWIFTIECSFFRQLMQEDFLLAEAVLGVQERKLWRTSHQLKNTMGSVFMERKLAAKLWKLSRDFGTDRPEGREIDIQMSVTFLADMLGASRETTSRLCGILEEKGLIRMEKKRIVIPDTKKMSYFYKTGKIL